MRRTAAVIVLVGLAATACARSVGDPGGLRVVPLGGDVRLVSHGDTVLLDQETDVGSGDLLATGPGGRALLQLGGAGSLELGSGARVRVDPRPEVLRGSVLVRAAAAGTAVQAGDAEIEATDSVFRVDRGFSVLLAVYRGAAEIVGSGIGDVPELRQTTVLAGGALPRGPEPLAVRPDHRWDIRLLGAAIDLGIELVELHRGLTRQLPEDDQRVVARALRDVLPEPLVEGLMAQVEAAETLVATEVSRAAAGGSGSHTLQRILEQVVDLRLEGAHWIVVAARWRLAGTGVLEGLERLAASIERLVSPPAGTTRFSGGGGPGGGAGGSPGGGGGSGATTSVESGTTPAGGGGSSGGSTDPTDQGGTGSGGGSSGGSGGSGQTTPPEPGCSNEVDCVVDDLVEDLGGVLGEGGGGGGGLLP